jgi:putative endopeptidase
VNGNWVKTTQIPSDKASWGSFNALRENVDDASLDILNKILSETYPAGSEGQKIQNLYASFMDTSKRNAEGLAPIKGDLQKLMPLKTLMIFRNTC